MKLAWATDIHLDHAGESARRKFCQSVKEQADALAADLIEAGSTEWFCLDINKQLFIKPFLIVSFQIKEAWPRVPISLGPR